MVEGYRVIGQGVECAGQMDAVKELRRPLIPHRLHMLLLECLDLELIVHEIDHMPAIYWTMFSRDP